MIAAPASSTISWSGVGQRENSAGSDAVFQETIVMTATVEASTVVGATSTRVRIASTPTAGPTGVWQAISAQGTTLKRMRRTRISPGGAALYITSPLKCKQIAVGDSPCSLWPPVEPPLKVFYDRLIAA